MSKLDRAGKGKGEGPSTPLPPAATTADPTPEALGADRLTSQELNTMRAQLSLLEYWDWWWKRDDWHVPAGESPRITCRVWPKYDRKTRGHTSADHGRYCDAVADVFAKVRAARIAAGRSVDWPFEVEED